MTPETPSAPHWSDPRPPLGVSSPEAADRPILEVPSDVWEDAFSGYRVRSQEAALRDELRGGSHVLVLINQGLGGDVLSRVTRAVASARGNMVSSMASYLFGVLAAVFVVELEHGDAVSLELGVEALRAQVDGVDINLLDAPERTGFRSFTPHARLVLVVPEQTGFVAKVADALFRSDANVERFAAWVSGPAGNHRTCVVMLEIATTSPHRPLGSVLANLEELVEESGGVLHEAEDASVSDESLARAGNSATHFVTVVGLDTPGLLARVTRPIVDLGGNIEGATEVSTQGYASIVLALSVSGDPEAMAAQLKAELDGALDQTAMLTQVQIGPTADSAFDGMEIAHLTFAHDDEVGLLAAVCEALEGLEVRIVRLGSKITTPTAVQCTIQVEMALPPHVSIAVVQAAMASLTDDAKSDFAILPGPMPPGSSAVPMPLIGHPS